MQKKKSDTVDINNENTEIASVETGFKLLDKCVEELSRDDISLEDSFKEFENGMKILKLVNERIERVEKKVKVITEEGMDEFQ